MRLLFLLILSALNMDAQTPEVMLLGKHAFEDLRSDTTGNYKWFYTGLSVGDTGATQATREIAKVKTDFKIIVVGGTWCSDTQNLLPGFYLTMDYANIDINKIVELYFTNRDKKVPEDIITKYNITNVPTFIVVDSKGNEVGRITESVKVSIADDLLEILRKL